MRAETQRQILQRFFAQRDAHTTEFGPEPMPVVFQEDDQQQDIHRSLRTGLMPEVVYGRNEPLLIHHHRQVEAALSLRNGRPTRPAPTSLRP